MQGRQGQGKDRDPWHTSAGQQLDSVNGTGKQRAIPQRPPSMAHLDQPPPTPRVARPKREMPSRVNWRRRLIIWVGIFIVSSLLACGIGYAAVNLITATNQAAGAATTVTDFLTALSNRNYDQAYNDLDATLTIKIPPDDFKQQAQNDDRCYGVVKNYSEIAGSATVQGNTQSYSYSITREKLSHPYTFRLTIQQNSDGDWKIISYGNNNDLGPGQPACS